jgi:hypothetical protein
MAEEEVVARSKYTILITEAKEAHDQLMHVASLFPTPTIDMEALVSAASQVLATQQALERYDEPTLYITRSDVVDIQEPDQ